ncbi:MAG: outer membrane protein assembly factor BamA [Desulfobacterales bacterium]
MNTAIFERRSPLAGWVWVLACLAAAAPGLCAEPEARPRVVDRVDVHILWIAGDTGEWESLARSLILIREGETFSVERLAAAIERLRQSGAFRAIDVPDPDWDGSPFVLTFRLTPFPRIADIRIRGAFPLLEDEVLSAVGYAVGGPFNAARAPGLEEAIRALYLEEGFIDPETTIAAIPDPGGATVAMSIDIHKGDFYQVRNVEISGNHHFSQGRLLARMKTWQAAWLPGSLGRFSGDRLDEDLKGLTRLYRREGFPEAVITADVARRQENGVVDISLRLDEGPRYDVEFEGYREFRKRTLKKDLVFFSEGNPGDLGLRKSIRNMRKRYQDAGYNEIKILSESESVTEKGRPVRRIRIRIDEGPRDVVESISIVGNRQLDDETLKDDVATRPPGWIADGSFTPETLAADLRSIRARYLQEGFGDAQITETVVKQESDPEGTRPVAIELSIAEGEQVRVADVRFEGLTVLGRTEAFDLLTLRPGEIYRSYMVTSDEAALASAVAERGYPHVTVTGSATVNGAARSVGLVYTVKEGPFVRMGRIHVLGNLRTRKQIVEEEMALRFGEPFSLSRMLASQRNIRSLNALDGASFAAPGLAEREDTVHLVAQVEERKPYYLQFGIGFDTDRRLYVNGKAGDRNLFGLNKDAWVGGEISEIGYMADMGVTEPRFLGTRISATTGVSAEEREDFNQDFGIRSLSAFLNFRRPLGENWEASLGFRLERREQYLTEDSPPDVDEEDIFDPRVILVSTPALTYNSTDSFVRPRRGALVRGSADWSTGLENSFDNFIKYGLDARWYTTPMDRLTFALRGRVGYIYPLSDESTIPQDQLFFLGGLGTVRGFDKNELRLDEEGDAAGGRTEILGSVEARIGLWGNLEGVTFYDVGSIQAAQEPGGSNRFRSSVGLGLRYVTPIGPISVVYGHKVDRDPGERAGAWHFSIGYSF